MGVVVAAAGGAGGDDDGPHVPDVAVGGDGGDNLTIGSRVLPSIRPGGRARTR